VFGFLRSLGFRIAPVGGPVERSVPILPLARSSTPPLDSRYSNWIVETSRLPSLHPVHQLAASPSSDSPHISILLACSRTDAGRLDRSLASLASQQYTNWDLVVCTGTDSEDWLNSYVFPQCGGHSIAITRGENIRSSLESALGKCGGEFVAIVTADAILEPDALTVWLAAFGPGTAAVYSDWDHIDTSGRRHTPRFTPELSPELLTHTLYWGRCYFARTAQLRETNSARDTPGLPVEHELALRLAEHSGCIVRVPRMLWHLQADAPEQSEDSASAGVAPGASVPEQAKSANAFPAVGCAGAGDRASIIICSRNPEQFRKCLQSLLPTLGDRHEVILVAHQTGNGTELEQVATSHGVRVVPYSGDFHFGVMNALGVAASSSPALCLMNDDVYPITSDWLDSMVAQAMRSDIGAVGALLMYPNGTIQHAGVVVGGGYFPSHVGRLEVDSPYWPWLRMTRELTAVTAACMVLRRSVWDELGGLDPQFPVNYNDTDLCLRIGERGYRILLEARAVLTHEESATRPPVVKPEEHELFRRRWDKVMSAPDRFFNPQLHLDAIHPVAIAVDFAGPTPIPKQQSQSRREEKHKELLEQNAEPLDAELLYKQASASMAEQVQPPTDQPPTDPPAEEKNEGSPYDAVPHPMPEQPRRAHGEEGDPALLYDAAYYREHCGLPYERSAHWLGFFGDIAETLIRKLKPRRVFDAGCAWGLLVEALRDRGVEAWGVDISPYAISQVRPNIQPFCRVASLTEPIITPEGLPEGRPDGRAYDLVTCIEVLEHMSEKEAEQAIRNLCAATDTIFFSSTPSDFTEPTHVNVRPIISWLHLFSEQGFAPDVVFDASFVTQHAFLLRRRPDPLPVDTLALFSEKLRIQSEFQRIQTENHLVRTESHRIQTDSHRIQTENQRIFAENQRIYAENERIHG